MSQLNGIDCATKLNSSTAAGLRADGIQYAARYLGNDWKSMNKSEADAIINTGLRIVSIWETNPTSVGYFTHGQGVSDGQQSSSYATALAQPAGSAIYFTVDYDVQLGDMPAILAYFAGVRQGIDKNYKVGVYGSIAVVERLHSSNAADFYWQTYAWSRGNTAPFISIYQYQNDVPLAGIQVDYNHFSNSAGSWGKGAVQPPSGGSTTGSGSSTPPPNTYVVQPGDTVSAIALKYGTSINELAQLNGIIDPNLIYPGQVIKLPGGSGNTGSTSSPTPSSPNTYTVQPGDTLSGIAAKFGTAVAALVQLNGIKDPNLITVGQILKLSGSATQPGPSGEVFYTIKPGDTLSQISLTFGTPISQLQAWNEIKDPNVIFAGQRIRVK